jgi:hypothetical protein
MCHSFLIVAALSVFQEPRVDFKVVTWYDRADPIATFQYRGYDVRKGEYTPAVDAWLATMRERHPNYEVVVQDVDLARETGPTDRRKVGAVIHRELLAAAAAEGLFLGSSAGSVVAKAPRTLRLRPIAEPRPYLPAVPMMFRQNPTPYGFPVPMPYPRPHP